MYQKHHPAPFFQWCKIIAVKMWNFFNFFFLSFCIFCSVLWNSVRSRFPLWFLQHNLVRLFCLPPTFQKIKTEHSHAVGGDVTACCCVALPVCTTPSDCRELQYLLPQEQTSEQEQNKGHHLAIRDFPFSVTEKSVLRPEANSDLGTCPVSQWWSEGVADPCETVKCLHF